MKKIIFCDIPMKKSMTAMVYAGTGNTNCTYSKPVMFAINTVLAESLKKDDEVRVILLRTLDKAGNSGKNSGLFMQELDAINADIGAKISYETLDSEFKETKDIHETRLKNMLSKIEENTEIYADITYGPKPLPMILMCVISFAEKFLNCDVKSVVYGKVDFDDNNKPCNPELYDVTSLYYLNNLTSSMVADNGKDARQSLNEFFSL
ncbi:MAG: hypothetical protein J6Y16_11430 [Treponema sp.]|nr:hypothetical protein [Treponema sp.]